MRYLPLAFLVLCAHSMPLHAAPLSLSEALVLLQQHPQWQATEAFIEQARGQQVTAGQYPNPSVDVATETHDRQSIALAFPVETSGVRRYRQASADAEVIVSIEQAQIRQRELRTVLKKQYHMILQRQQELALAKEEFALLGQLRHAVKLRVSVGEAAKYESVKAEAEWLSSQNRLNMAQQKLSLSFNQLAEYLALPALPQVSEVGTTLSKSCAMTQSAHDYDLSQHPLMLAAKAAVTRDQAGLRHEEAQVTPQPTLILGNEHEMGIDRVKIGVSLPLPLWHQRDGQIAASKAKNRQSEAQLIATERELKQSLTQAVSNYQSADSQFHVYESGLLREAEAAFNVAKAAYKHGERGLLEYIDAQRTLASVKRAYVNSQFERRYACFDIEQITQPIGATQ